MNVRTRRLIVRSLAVAAVCVLVLGGWLVADTLAVGVGYKAKMLCSGVFVSGHNLETVLSDLQADDLAVLKYINASIEPNAKSVTTSFLGTVRRRAVYRQGLGCALVLDGFNPPALPDSQSTREVTAVEAPLPRGSEPRIPPLDDASPGGVEAAVERAFSEPDPRHRRRTLAVVVVRRGRIVAEQYAPGIGPDTPLAGWSMTKSVMNALVGILIRDHWLAIDSPVPIPEWQHAGDPRAAITLDQLLRMSSGLRFDEGMVSSRSDVMRMLFGAGDVATFAATKGLAFAPGTKWQYSSGTSNILAWVIRNALSDETAFLAALGHPAH